jgi:hypothetical protein
MGEHWGWWLMNSRCFLSGACYCTGGLLTWACKLATVLVKFSRSWVWVWKNSFVLAVVLGLNGFFSLDGSRLVDQLQILTWCSPSQC